MPTRPVIFHTPALLSFLRVKEALAVIEEDWIISLLDIIIWPKVLEQPYLMVGV